MQNRGRAHRVGRSNGRRQRRFTIVRLAATLIGVAIVVVLTLVALASPVSAHAAVSSSVPQDGGRLGAAPAEVRVVFSEPVSLALGGLVVVDDLGRRVDTGDLTEVAGSDTIGVLLQRGLRDGTYTASYRVVSSDGHPISGAITFGIGVAPDRPGSVASADRSAEAIGWVARWMTYLAALAACGIGFFLWFVDDGGSDRPRLSRLAFCGVAVVLIGVVGQLIAHASLATGRGLGAVADRSLWGPVLGNNLGWSTVLVVVGVAGSAASTVLKGRFAGPMLSLYSLVVVAVSFAIWGHSVEGTRAGLQIAADAVHPAAGAIWLGGLIAVVVLPLGLGEVASRFSRAALATTIALVFSGVLLSWREVGDVSALWGSQYGVTLLGKVAVVAAVLVVAAFVRFRVLPKVVAPGPEFDRATIRRIGVRFRRGARAEVIGIAVVLAVTAGLVNMLPARTELGRASAQQDLATPVDVTVPFGADLVNLTATPGRTGPNEIHVGFMDASGRPLGAASSIELRFSQPEAGIEPVVRSAAPSGTGHFVLSSQTLGVSGTWQVEIVARVGDFEQRRSTVEITVGR